MYVRKNITSERKDEATVQYGPRRLGCYGAYTSTVESQSRPFPTEPAAHALAEKYDVTRLSRNGYSLLLCELRNVGYITSQEFSAGYGGTLPRNVAAKPFPLGENEADFVALLGEYKELCKVILRNSAKGSPERVHTRSLADTYSRLHRIFKQMQDAAPETEQKTIIN